MSFYLKLPRGVTTLNILESCVQQRLDFYNNSDNNIFEFSNFDCLVEDTGLDRTGHFMLRLYATLRPNFAYKFIQNEQKLLNIRIHSYNYQDTKKFFRKILKHCNDIFHDSLTEDIKHFYVFLQWLASVMLNPSFLSHIFDDIHLKNDYCSHKYFSVPFQYCYTLIPNRDYELSYGKVQVDCKSWRRLLSSVYGIYLKLVLKEMRMNKCVKHILSDSRIKQIMNFLKETLSGNYEHNNNNKQKFEINKIKEESELFPLCMKSLYVNLVQTNRLTHNDRFDFSLFMKGIGVTVGDSLKFWEEMYSKQHSSCSKCTHSWQQSEKRYIYGIRHLYGLEGSRKNYSPRSCNFLQEKSVGPIEEGGCPFTHFDDNNLRKLLKSVLPEDNENLEVIIHKRKSKPNVSCSLLHESMYKKLNSDPKNHKTEFQNPVQYYLLLKDGVKGSDR